MLHDGTANNINDLVDNQEGGDRGVSNSGEPELKRDDTDAGTLIASLFHP